MQLSLISILNEITARKGPRTGVFEMDEEAIYRKAIDLENSLRHYWRRHEKIDPQKRSMIIKNPITDKWDSISIFCAPSPEGDKYGAFFDIKAREIHLEIPANFFQLDDSQRIRIISSLLFHELTHAFDPTKWKNPKGLIGYFNSREELKAYMQQIWQEMTEQLYEWSKSPKMMPIYFKYTKKNPEYILKFCGSWRVSKKYLNKRSKQKIYMMVFQFLKHFEERLGQIK